MSIPPFSQVIKSRDVEDPVNVWLHRPLAYAFVQLTYRTPLTPNQITFMAMFAGIAAGVCWAMGTPQLMLLGGILLWSSSILDGADGIMARAKSMQSEFGRALDGTADAIVALVTTVAAFWNIWQAGHSWVEVALMPIAVISTVMTVTMYDFYKEYYLGSTRGEWPDPRQKIEEIRAKAESSEASGAPLIVRFAWSSYASMLRAQGRYIQVTNPALWDSKTLNEVTEEGGAAYRRLNYGPMQLWAALSLCPHTYIIAICAMNDRLDLYLWFRALGASALFALTMAWQRVVSERTLKALEAMDSGLAS